MKVLFIGNSYTYYNDMPTLFGKLANSNGKSVTVYSITKGGRKLEQYADPADPITVSLDALLATEILDVCFIQEQSLMPAVDSDRFAAGLECVVSKLTGKAGKFILYATWGRKTGSSVLTEHQWTTEGMTHLVMDAYQKAAKRYNAQISPVGNSFLYITKNHPEIDLYDKDLTHPSYLGSCLSALTHYYTVFHEFPTLTDALSLSKAELAALKAAVCQLTV